MQDITLPGHIYKFWISGICFNGPKLTSERQSAEGVSSPLISDIVPVELAIHRRFLKFVCNGLMHTNSTVTFIFSLCEKQKFDKNDICLLLWWNSYQEQKWHICNNEGLWCYNLCNNLLN